MLVSSHRISCLHNFQSQNIGQTALSNRILLDGKRFRSSFCQKIPASGDYFRLLRLRPASRQHMKSQFISTNCKNNRFNLSTVEKFVHVLTLFYVLMVLLNYDRKYKKRLPAGCICSVNHP